MLNLDSSLFFVALLVWFLLVVLNKIYFKPVGQVLDQRESKIESESSRIETMTREIDEKTQQIEKKLKDAKQASARIKEELIKKGEEAREQLLIKTRSESQKLRETRMSELDAQILAAEKKLSQEVSVFSDKLKEIFIG
ncbi:MAG: hypothetical protein QG657_3493 [Acidobacteriota bacterium]|nr:hypothetical protein [Acidobacteriota bacterium]